MIPFILFLVACAGVSASHAEGAPIVKPSSAPSAVEAEQFVKEAEARLERLGIEGTRAAWVSRNFITDDTEAIAAQAYARYLAASGEIAVEARRYHSLKLAADTARKLKFLQQSLVFASSIDRESYARIAADVVRSALTDRPDADSDLYDFR